MILDKNVYSVKEAEAIQEKQNWTEQEYEKAFDSFYSFITLDFQLPEEATSIFYVKLTAEDKRIVKRLTKSQQDSPYPHLNFALNFFLQFCCIVELLKEEIRKKGIFSVYELYDNDISIFTFEGYKKAMGIKNNLNNQKTHPFYKNLKTIRFDKKDSKKNIDDIIKYQKNPRGQYPIYISPKCHFQLFMDACLIKEAIMKDEYNDLLFQVFKFSQNFTAYYIFDISNELHIITKKARAPGKGGRTSNIIERIYYGKKFDITFNCTKGKQNIRRRTAINAIRPLYLKDHPEKGMITDKTILGYWYDYLDTKNPDLFQIEN